MSIQTSHSKSVSFLRFAWRVCASCLLIGLNPISGRDSVRAEELSVQQSQLLQSGQMDCQDRMKEFVSDLDALLDQNPPTLEPFLSLLKRTFPLTGCDIQ